MKLNKLLAVVGPSGSGKSTLVNSVFDYTRQLVSFTTRQPRKNEKDGQDYYFLTKENIYEMQQNNEIAELVEYDNNYYGYTKSEIEEKLSKNVCAAIVTIDGYKTMKHLLGKDNIVPMFVYADRDSILKHMQNRIGLDSKTNIEKRLALYDKEMKNMSYLKQEGAILHDDSGLTVNESIKKFKQEIAKIK